MKKYKNYLILLIIIVSFLVGVCFVPVGISKFIPVIEQQVESDLGVKIHVDKLIMRVGPSIKVKSPIVHIMYLDGRKFAQLDNVKFYISWSSLIKDAVKINKMKARKLTLRVNSDDKEFYELVNILKNKEFGNSPDITLKEYNFSYNNKEYSEKYVLEGHSLELDKILQFKNYKIKTSGSLLINNKKYLTYDLNCLPLLEFKDKKVDIDYPSIVKQLKEVDFYADLIADIKVYKTKQDEIQASGFINIDNMAVLDPMKKNPKSFIYLTLWGDKASILSNIYTSPSKKIYVEGMVNNSKKPVLDLKVKTDDINLTDLHKKLRILTTFSILKNIDAISGVLNADFTLKGDINKIKSNGFLKIDNASIKASGVEIDKITSDIDFSNNVVNIVNTTGYVNNSPILVKGKLDKEVDVELLMNKVDLKHLTPSIIGVKTGIASVVANIKGPINNINHKEKIQIEDLNIENKDLNLSIESFNIDTNKNNTAYVTNVQCKTPYTSLIKMPSLKLFIDSNTLKMPETNIFMQNSMLSVKAEVNDYNKDFIFNSVISGYINSKDITKYNSYSSRFPLKLVINGNKYVQNINSQILIENSSIFEEPTVINLVSKVDKNALKFEDLSLVGYSGENFNDTKIISKLPKKMTITGVVENLKTPVMKNLRVFIPQQLNLHVYDSIIHLKGDLFVNGNIEKPDVIGQLLIQNLINQNLQLAVTNASLDFNKNTAVFAAPSVKLADTALSLNANVSTDISNGILINGLNIKSKFLNIDTLLMYKDAPILNGIQLTVKNAKIYIERVLSNIYNSQIYLSALNSEMELINNVVNLKNFSAEMYNGKIAGVLDFNLKDEHFKTNLMARGVSAAPIFDIISTRKDSISGTMDFDAKLEGNLTSKQSLSGDVKFVVNNGRMSTLGKLEHLLYAQNVIADNMLRTSLSVVTKAITLKDTGLFKYLRGDVTLNNGIAYVNMLQSQGPLMSLFIKGQFNPINDYAQLTVLGRLSDEIITGLGAFADFSFKKLLVMLTGEESKNSILPEDFDKIPQLPMKNTKEFRSIINGIIDKPSSVILFNWIAYSQKSLKQTEKPMTDAKLPDFVENLPY